MNTINLILNLSRNRKIKAQKLVPQDFYKRLINNFQLENKVIIGPRRLGKTTYLYSLANKSQDKCLFIDFSSSHFFDFDFQNSGKKLSDFKRALIWILESGKFNLVLMDEIQLLSNWSLFLKSLVDDFPNIKFIATGSDAESLKNSGESGVGRFKIHFIGPITFYESKKVNPKLSIDQYIQNCSFPSVVQKDLDMKYQLIYEKQFRNKKFYLQAVNNIMRIIALNPGERINRNNFVKQIRETSDVKADSKQVAKIINFLIDSQLIQSLPDIKTNLRARNENVYTLYPTDWLTYLFFNETSYTNLSNDTNPKRGLVFENMVIANVLSFFNTPNKRNKVFNKISNPDIDLIVNRQKYEIKSIDVLKSEKKNEYLEKALETQSIIIHNGKSTKIKLNQLQTVELINVEEFLLNDELVKTFNK